MARTIAQLMFAFDEHARGCRGPFLPWTSTCGRVFAMGMGVCACRHIRCWTIVIIFKSSWVLFNQKY